MLICEKKNLLNGLRLQAVGDGCRCTLTVLYPNSSSFLLSRTAHALNLSSDGLILCFVLVRVRLVKFKCFCHFKCQFPFSGLFQIHKDFIASQNGDELFDEFGEFGNFFGFGRDLSSLSNELFRKW